MSKFESSKKFTGIIYTILKNGDKSYYITYKLAGKFTRIHIGKKSEGVNEAFCHQKRNEMINNIKFGNDTPIVKNKKKTGVMLQDLADIYFSESYENKANDRQRGRYNLHMKHRFGRMDIEDLSREMILKWRKELMDKKKAPKTVNGIIQLLSIIINYSIRHKELKLLNPCIAVKALKTDDKRERYLTLDEIRLLKQRVSHDTELVSFVLLALSTGGRLETIMNIKKKDIQLETDGITLLDTKNSLTYSGFINDETKSHLLKMLSSLHVNDFIIGASPDKFSTSTLQKRLQKILNAEFNIGLKVDDRKNRVVIHSLRHTFASHLAINGVPILTIKKLMNHSDIEQTMRYAKLAPDSGLLAIKDLYK